MNQSKKLIQKFKQRIKSDNFWHRKVGRPITKWGEKSNIAIGIFEKSHF